MNNNDNKNLTIGISDGNSHYDENGFYTSTANEDYNEMHDYLEQKNPELAKTVEKTAIVATKVKNIITIVVCSIMIFGIVGVNLLLNIPNIIAFVYRDNTAIATITEIDEVNHTYTLTYELNGEEKTIDDNTYFESEEIAVGDQYKLYFDKDDNLRLTLNIDDGGFDLFSFAFPIIILIFLIYMLVKSIKSLAKPNNIDLDGGVSISFK